MKASNMDIKSSLSFQKHSASNQQTGKFVSKLITSRTNWPSNKKMYNPLKRVRENEQRAIECFTAIIRRDKYKYHIQCDRKSILLISFKHL